MSQHCPYYDALVPRYAQDDPTLTADERQELELHWLICPACRHAYGRALMPRDPQAALRHLAALQASLTRSAVRPYLPSMAHAAHMGQPFTSFQRFLWDFVIQDQRTLGYFLALKGREALRTQHGDPAHSIETS